MNKARIISSFIFLSLVTTMASAQEWTQWRGPARDGSISSKDALVTWPEALKRSWRVEIGEGYSSPVVAGGRVFVHGRRDPEEIVSSINLADGKIVWQQKYQAEFKKNQYAVEMAKGPHATPLVAGNRLFTLGVTGILNAWDTAVGMTEGSIVGLEGKTGKELWTIAFPDEWHENISTPLWTGTHLVVSGTRQGTHAYTLTQVDGKWHATEVWKNPDIAMYMSSPVFGDGLIYGHSSKKKGQFFALDAKTGTVRWTTEGREGEHASLLLTPQHIIFLTNGADLIVAKRGTPAFTVERRYEVAEAATFATPILLGSNIVVRDATGLMLLTAGK
ncbi:MAG TPA: PQQ-binding-like beta-propeller repeat protein [Pyrinomonadaceae bacterium]